MRPVGCAGAPHYIIPHLRKNVKYFDKNILRPVGSSCRVSVAPVVARTLPRPVGWCVLSGRPAHFTQEHTQHTQASCRVAAGWNTLTYAARSTLRPVGCAGILYAGTRRKAPRARDPDFSYHKLRSKILITDTYAAKKKKKKKVTPFIKPQILRFVNSFDKNFLKNIFGKILDILLKI